MELRAYYIKRNLAIYKSYLCIYWSETMPILRDVNIARMDETRNTNRILIDTKAYTTGCKYSSNG
jgi:hypothetical protein